MLKKAPRSRLDYLKRELEGIEQLLYNLRHNRGRWPGKWCKGMIRHYERQHEKLRASISRLRRAAKR